MDEWVGVGVLVLYWGTDIRRWNAVQYSEVSTVQYNTVNTMHITHAINTTKSDGNQQSNYLMSLWSLKKECSTIQCNTVQYDYSNKFSTSPRFQNGYEVNSTLCTLHWPNQTSEMDEWVAVGVLVLYVFTFLWLWSQLYTVHSTLAKPNLWNGWMGGGGGACSVLGYWH